MSDANPLIIALNFLLKMVFDFAILLFLLRYVLKLTRPDNFNPLSQTINTLTQPILRRFRPWFPNLGHWDTALLLILLIIGMLKLLTLFWLKTGESALGIGLPLWAFADVSIYFVNILFFILLIGVIVSWVIPQANSPVLLLVERVSITLLSPIRRYLPSLAGLDFSPLVAMLGLKLIDILVLAPLGNIGMYYAIQ